MFQTAIRMGIRALFALTLLSPSPSLAAAETEKPALKSSNNLEIQRGVGTSVLEILVNGAVVIESDQPFKEISVANPNIADISTLSGSSIYLLGKNPGGTTLRLIGNDGEIISVVDILVTPDITEFKQRLAPILPGENIQAFTANDGIVLVGKISSLENMNQALELASRYAPDRISNLMTHDIVETGFDVTEIQEKLVELFPEEEIDVQVVNDGIILTGLVSTKNRIERALKLVEQYAPGRVTSLMTSAELPEELEADLLASKLQEILPGEKIDVHAFGNTIVLSGTASSDLSVAQAIQLIKVLSPESEVSNLVSVSEITSCSVRTRRGGEIVEMPVPCSG